MAEGVRHYCDYPSCDKSFRRTEHLKRHQLNHTNCTIQCPKCDRIFYRNDLLQRHLTLKHRKSPKNGGTHDTGQGSIVVENPAVSNAVDDHSPGNGRPESLSNTDHTPQNSNLTHGHSGISPLSSISPDPPDLLMIQESVPFTPFPLEGNGHNYGWIYHAPSEPTPVSTIPVLTTGQGDIGQAPAPQSSLFETEILQDFYVTPETHRELLSLIPIGDDSPLNAPDEVARVLDIAFSTLAESLPIFHRPTLNFEFLRRELSVSIFCFGLLVSERPDFHEIGCSLLHRLREETILFSHNNTIKVEQVWVLQSMLILEFGGMFYANRKAMELSDIFHGTMVTLARRLGIFQTSYEPSRPSSNISPDSRWLEWIHKESLKRLAYFIFVLDVQHSLLFGHDRSIFSVFSVKLDLPCDDREWRAVGAHEWSALASHSASGRMKFHEIHNALLYADDPSSCIPYLDTLNAYLILSGLASITMNFLQRHQEHSVDRKGTINRLGKSLHILRGRLGSAPESTTKNHAQMLYYVSLISLYTPLEDLEHAANAGYSFTGLTPKQHTRSAIVRLLTKNKVRAESARHAIGLIRVYVPLGLGTSSPYETSGLYLATLTLWAYLIGQGYDDESPLLPASSTDSEALDGMENSLEDADMTSCGIHWRTLVQHVADRLSGKLNDNAREYSQVLRSLIALAI